MLEKCIVCGNNIGVDDKFCSNCGAKVPRGSVSLSSAQKIKIYLVSILLAPFGIYWFFKYFKNENSDNRKVAFTVLFITIFMIVVLVGVNLYLINTLQSYIGTYDNILYGF